MEENKFKCNECKKYYKSYQSLWHHKNRFHMKISTNISTNINNYKIKKTDQTECEHCNKILSCYKSLHRHYQSCKLKNIKLKQNELLIKQQDEIIKQNNELIRQNEELSKKLDLINTTNKTNINTGTINNTTNNTSNSNNTITNNINIFRLGCETILENLPTEEVLYILRLSKYNPLLEATKKTNFDKDHPEGHNWYNSNLRENFVTVYDKDTNKTIRESKEEIIDYILQQRINELEELSYKHKDELTEEQMNNIDNIVKNDYPPYISEKVKTMAYQNKDMVKKTMEQVLASK